MNRDSKIAEQLDKAVIEKRTIPRITVAHPLISVQDAYQIQRLGVQLRLNRGEKRIGFKMGLTSKVKQQQMCVDCPICGVLTDAMKIPAGGECHTNRFIHPKCEPEIAFIVDREIKGIVTPDKVIESCSGVCAAIDIIDSRYDRFQFTLPDIIADNCSAAGFVLSHEIIDPKGMDLSNLIMTFTVNGQIESTGNSSAILGNPVNAVVELARLLAQENSAIPPGSIVLCGGAMAAINLSAGMKVGLDVAGLGSVGFTAVDV